MQNEVNNETENSKTGENPVMDTTNSRPQPPNRQRPRMKPPRNRGFDDIDFGAILEQFEQEQAVFHAGELVEGKVVGVSDRGVLVDFGYKSEGVIPAKKCLRE